MMFNVIVFSSKVPAEHTRLKKNKRSVRFFGIWHCMPGQVTRARAIFAMASLSSLLLLLLSLFPRQSASMHATAKESHAVHAGALGGFGADSLLQLFSWSCVSET